MTDAEEPGLFERVRKWVAGERDATPASEPPAIPGSGSPISGCEGSEEISCREAIERAYEYLDGELDPEVEEEIWCHVEQCRRCYPMYDWEQMFLDFIRERADRAETNPALRREVEALLERESERGR